jgi:hypothetical protein
VGAEYGYGEELSGRSADVFCARRDDRPSTGPLGRSEKAALVSGSSSALLGRRRRVSVGWLAAPRGAGAVSRGAGAAVSRGAGAVSRGAGAAFRGAAAAARGGLLLAAARTGCVAAGGCDFMLWTGCVAA